MRAIVLFAALTFAACSPASDGYPPQYELSFMQSCQSAGATVAVCSCMWRRIEAEVPVSDFRSADQALSLGQPHPLTEKLNEFSNACRAAPATTTTSGG